MLHPGGAPPHFRPFKLFVRFDYNGPGRPNRHTLRLRGDSPSSPEGTSFKKEAASRIPGKLQNGYVFCSAEKVLRGLREFARLLLNVTDDAISQVSRRCVESER